LSLISCDTECIKSLTRCSGQLTSLSFVIEEDSKAGEARQQLFDAITELMVSLKSCQQLIIDMNDGDMMHEPMYDPDRTSILWSWALPLSLQSLTLKNIVTLPTLKSSMSSSSSTLTASFSWCGEELIYPLKESQINGIAPIIGNLNLKDKFDISLLTAFTSLHSLHIGQTLEAKELASLLSIAAIRNTITHVWLHVALPSNVLFTVVLDSYPSIQSLSLFSTESAISFDETDVAELFPTSLITPPSSESKRKVVTYGSLKLIEGCGNEIQWWNDCYFPVISSFSWELNPFIISNCPSHLYKWLATHSLTLQSLSLRSAVAMDDDLKVEEADGPAIRMISLDHLTCHSSFIPWLAQTLRIESGQLNVIKWITNRSGSIGISGYLLEYADKNDNTLPFGLTHQPSPSTLHRRPYTIIDATDMTSSLIANAEWRTVAASGSDPLER
jgi:hypothetical protein